MSTTSRTEVYGVRLTPDELSELKAMAEARNENLADAFREGAKHYLGKGYQAAVASELEGAIAKAQDVLRSAREEKE